MTKTMTDVAIRVDRLSKSYAITQTSGARGYRTLREDVLETANGPLTSRRLFAVCATCPQAVMAL